MQSAGSSPFVYLPRPIFCVSLTTCVSRVLTLPDGIILSRFIGAWCSQWKIRAGNQRMGKEMRVFLPCLFLLSPTVLAVAQSSPATTPVRQLLFHSLSSPWTPEIPFLLSSLQSQETASHCFWSLGTSTFFLDSLNPVHSYMNCPFTILSSQFQLSMP